MFYTNNSFNPRRKVLYPSNECYYAPFKSNDAVPTVVATASMFFIPPTTHGGWWMGSISIRSIQSYMRWWIVCQDVKLCSMTSLYFVLTVYSKCIFRVIQMQILFSPSTLNTYVKIIRSNIECICKSFFTMRALHMNTSITRCILLLG